MCTPKTRCRQATYPCYVNSNFSFRPQTFFNGTYDCFTIQLNTYRRFEVRRKVENLKNSYNVLDSWRYREAYSSLSTSPQSRDMSECFEDGSWTTHKKSMVNIHEQIDDTLKKQRNSLLRAIMESMKSCEAQSCPHGDVNKLSLHIKNASTANKDLSIESHE